MAYRLEEILDILNSNIDEIESNKVDSYSYISKKPRALDNTEINLSIGTDVAVYNGHSIAIDIVAILVYKDGEKVLRIFANRVSPNKYFSDDFFTVEWLDNTLADTYKTDLSLEVISLIDKVFR